MYCITNNLTELFSLFYISVIIILLIFVFILCKSLFCFGWVVLLEILIWTPEYSESISFTLFVSFMILERLCNGQTDASFILSSR